MEYDVNSTTIEPSTKSMPSARLIDARCIGRAGKETAKRTGHRMGIGTGGGSRDRIKPIHNT